MQRSFLKSLGPGLIFAGAAVGVSHLVQATRAGAEFGLALCGVVLMANVLKYPAFSFGPRYAAATGTSLLEGYRRQGRWAILLFGVLTLTTMFAVEAAVTVVTAALAAATFGIRETALGMPPILWLSLLILGGSASLIAAGRYRCLDGVTKVLVALLTLSTIAATLAALPRVNLASFALWPPSTLWQDPRSVFFMAALVGWMPSAFDVSVWHSLWTLARREQTEHAPSVNESLLDFNIGYLGTALLALAFLAMGAALLSSDVEFAPSAPAFAAQIISLYTQSLGTWVGPIIAAAALATMFSTTLTVVDGFPRVLGQLRQRWHTPETPGEATIPSKGLYWGAVGIIAVGALAIIALVPGRSFKTLVDGATTLSFLAAPAIALLNHRAMTSDAVPTEYQPGFQMRLFSVAGIVFSALFACYYLWLRGTLSL